MDSSFNSHASEELELFDSPNEVDDASSLYLLGKVLASKSLNNNAVSSIIKGAWKVRGELSISPWNVNTFLFQFSKEEDRNRILRDCPWSIMGSLLVLQTLSPKQTMEEVDFTWCPFWVQAHGLPIQNMSKQNGIIIGNRLGKVISVEAPKDGLLLHHSFLHIRVEINTQHPLPREVGSKSGYGPDFRTGVARTIVSPVDFAQPVGVSSKNSNRPNNGNSSLAPMAAHGLGVQIYSTTAEPPPYSPSPLPASCAHTPAPPQLAACGMSNSPPRGPQSEAAFTPTPSLIEASSSPSLIKPYLTTTPSLQPFGPNTGASSGPDANNKPKYFVTEPPESPCTPHSPKEFKPNASTTDLGLTDEYTILLTPNPILQPPSPSYALDLCLSKAINTLSLKRKASADVLSSTQPLKLLKTTETQPSKQLTTLHSTTTLQRGNPRRPISTRGRKLVKRRV
ncbi:hypothetical protein ACSBR2_017233 [Camellia fascicularis]